MSGASLMTRVAVLIDGGYLLRRLPSVQTRFRTDDPQDVCRSVNWLITAHLRHLNKIAKTPHARSLLYRAFFYDARPYLDKGHKPVSGGSIHFEKTDVARFHLALHDALRKSPNMAVRLGEVRRDADSLWELRPGVLKDLLKKKRVFDDLTDDDFRPTFRQKAVDMRLGVDIASLTLKRQVDTIVLVTGDADFVPAAKLARREGLRIVLDPLWRDVDAALFEHIDGLYSGFPNPKRNSATQEATHDA